MKPLHLAAALLSVVLSFTCQAEILAMLNYESKPNDALKDLKLPFGAQERREGIAIVDVDPESENYGNILSDIPLPNDLTAHHVFYNRDATKVYLTALGKPEVRVIDLQQNPYRVKVIETPGCVMGEDIIFSMDNSTWYETCMGSSNIMVGDAVSDTFTHIIESNVPYPHGIALHEGIDRLLVTSTVNPQLQDPGETIGVIELSTGKGLSVIKVSDKPTPSGEAPVEVLFVPESDPPVAWVSNMFGGTLWALTWNPESGEFDAAKAHDFEGSGAGVVLELYFNADGSKMWVTTANPGKMHFFDLNEAGNGATLTKTLDTAGGAHHIGFTKDGRYAYVQNSFINLPGMNDGSVSVVDMQTEEVIDTINIFKDNGFNPNCIILLPEWNNPMGH